MSVSIADLRLAADRSARFKDLVRFVFAVESVEKYRLSLAFVDNTAIHELNRRFLKHDYPTDVLTFPLGRGKQGLEGEIVISGEYALAECQEYNHPPHWEASLYVIHGILHLVGYDDSDEASARKMEQRQESLLKQFVDSRRDQPYTPARSADS